MDSRGKIRTVLRTCVRRRPTGACVRTYCPHRLHSGAPPESTYVLGLLLQYPFWHSCRALFTGNNGNSIQPDSQRRRNTSGDGAIGRRGGRETLFPYQIEAAPSNNGVVVELHGGCAVRPPCAEGTQGGGLPQHNTAARRACARQGASKKPYWPHRVPHHHYFQLLEHFFYLVLMPFVFFLEVWICSAALIHCALARTTYRRSGVTLLCRCRD